MLNRESAIQNAVEAALAQCMIEHQKPEVERLVRKLFEPPSEDETAETMMEDGHRIRWLSGHGSHNWMVMQQVEEQASRFLLPIRLAFAIRAAWQMGKVGFPLLHDPNDYEPERYADKARNLLTELTCDWSLDPRDLMPNTVDEPDLDFYESLPHRFVVYRGGFDIDSERLGAGVCWTTRQDIAEFFATRWSGEPRLLRAVVSKQEVATAFAYEFEIAVQPESFEEIGPQQIRDGRWHCPRPQEFCWVRTNGNDIEIAA